MTSSFALPVLPSLATAVAEDAKRHRHQLSLRFLLGGEHPQGPLPSLPARPLPSMFRPLKTEPAQDSSYGRVSARPLPHHRFSPLARVAPPPQLAPPPLPSVSATRSSPTGTSSPPLLLVSRHPPPPPSMLSNPPKKKTYDQMTKAEKRKSRACRVDGCESYIINRGLCFRHGGGKRCAEPGCDSSAKNQGLCWKHGGSTNCIIDGCTRRGKARGLCWAHGGGTQCSTQNCTTIAVSNGKCWAHGGGKRCSYDGCTRAAYERTYNYCLKHHELLRDGHHSVDL